MIRGGSLFRTMMFYFVVLVAVILVIRKFVYHRIFPKKPLDVSKLGEWAVVTGATDGIGKAFVEELAALGLNIVLISRNREKLEAFAREISNKHGVNAKGIQAEFTLQDDKMYELIRKEVGNVEVGVLVNNVGMGYVHPEYFHELEAHQQHIYQAIVNCNVISAVRMCQYVLPGMISRRKGLIINVSSMLSEIPAPFISLYGGSKAFLSKFSTDLAQEVERHGVRVHLLRTGTVATKLLRVRETSWIVPSPATYVKSALKDVTSLQSVDSTGYVAHTIAQNIIKVLVSLFPGFSERNIVELGLQKRELLKEKCKHCNPANNQALVR
uniref:Estradiol 17-beta-dehydrogenase 12 n=2 Tax=Lygus hesperus TaxID=30085 RepID=A0A0A9Y5A5_LYGHE